MPDQDFDPPIPGASAGDAGPFPIGAGWMAGDFQNCSGLLGLVRPADYALNQVALGDGSAAPAPASGGSGPFPIGGGWTAGDFQNGSGLLGVSAPPAPSMGWLAAPPMASPSSTSADTEDTQDTQDTSDAPETSDDDADDDDGDDAQPDVASPDQEGHLDYGLAHDGDAQFTPVITGRTFKRQFEKRTGLSWPRTEDGRSYHAHHRQARADGGSNDYENYEAMHPDEHLAHHMANGDFSRWGKRGGGGFILRPNMLLRVRPHDPFDIDIHPPPTLSPFPGKSPTIPNPIWEEGEEE